MSTRLTDFWRQRDSVSVRAMSFVLVRRARSWFVSSGRARKILSCEVIVGERRAGWASRCACYGKCMTNVFRVDNLTDEELLTRTSELVARGRRVEAVLIAHLAEVDERRLYLREACSSMFGYATERLHLSEPEAYLRIHVARVSRRFPQVLAMLEDGRLHLSAIDRLAPHLTPENADEVLARAVHRSRREVELLIAELTPRPDVPDLVRKLPVLQVAASNGLRPDGVIACTVVASATPAVVMPLAPERFKVQFTASAELEAKITRATALLRHQIPTGDLSAIIDRAMTLLLADLERTKCAVTDRPRTPAQAKGAPYSRHVPAPIRRAVWQRDEGRCTFVDARGLRCNAMDRVEFHHVVPFARGGDHSVENLRLLCGPHNGHQAELDYGRDLIEERKRDRARASPS